MSFGNEKQSTPKIDQATAALLLEALSLNHGEGCGVRYFVRPRNQKLRAALMKVLQHSGAVDFQERWQALLEEFRIGKSAYATETDSKSSGERSDA